MFGSVLEGTTQDSIDENSKLNSMNKTTSIMWDGDAFKLPNILDCSKKANTSPFKGFLDISIVNQQLRKTLPDAQDFDIGKEIPFQHRPKKNTFGMPSLSVDVAITGKDRLNTVETTKGTRFSKKDKQVQMNPKVLETWINETLKDAEHLDIPGVVLKPEHKEPIARHGIDRLSLQMNNIDNE